MIQFENNLARLRSALSDADIDVAIITDDDAVYYFTGYYDYLHMEFGRPTILVVPRDDECVLITPSIDYNTALANARVDRIEAWNDGVGQEWREHLPSLLARPRIFQCKFRSQEYFSLARVFQPLALPEPRVIIV